VQLVGGDPKTKKDYGDPVETALDWVDKGAQILHVVDLDATLGLGNNLGVALKIRRESGLPIEFGGGVRSLDALENVLGALDEEDRVIVGTLGVKEYPGFGGLKKLGGNSERVILSVDSKEGYVAVKGWQEKSKLKASELISESQEYVWGYLFTNVDVEGKMQGIDYDAVEDVVSCTDKPVIVSGGISSAGDVNLCRKAGAWGVVLGKALYEGKIELEDVV